MALRQIRLLGDEILTKPCREVKEMTPRLQELIEDMLETMYDANGVGLSAPQVGVLRRIVVIDVWQEDIVDENAEAEEAAEAEAAGATAEAGERKEPEAVAETVTATSSESTAASEVAPESAEESLEESETGEAEEKGEESEDGEKPEDGEEPEDGEDVMEGPLIMINPVITYTEGEQTADEGCLSLPGKAGKVTRPMVVRVTYLDENMEEYELEGEGLLARAICHEVDHLEGHMYVELVEGKIHDVGAAPEEEEESEEGGSSETSANDSQPTE